MQCPYLRRSERLSSTAVHHRLKAAAFLHKAAIGAAAAKVRFVRIADIYVFSREGPVWVILSFKQRSIDVNGYQPSQAEELLLIYPNRVYFDFFKERLQAF